MSPLPVIALSCGRPARERWRELCSSEDPSSRAEPCAGRSLIWADEFEGPRGSPPDPGRWTLDTGYGWGDAELQSYTDRPSNVSLDGEGNLAITARQEKYTGADGATARYTSGRLNTQEKFEFAYGKVEARIQSPAGRGLLPAFWAAGSNLDASAGRRWRARLHGDKRRDPRTLHVALHGPRRGDTGYRVGARLRSPTALSDAFHVYGAIWSPGRIAFTLDGKVHAVRTPARASRAARGGASSTRSSSCSRSPSARGGWPPRTPPPAGRRRCSSIGSASVGAARPSAPSCAHGSSATCPTRPPRPEAGR